jgi:hypothetical protein
MTLATTFSLTPRNSYYSAGGGKLAKLNIYGALFLHHLSSTYPYCFDRQHAQDQLYFHGAFAGNPALDYKKQSNRELAPHIYLNYDLRAFGQRKELALVFQFKADSDSRLYIYSNASLLDKETLYRGDNQFLMEIETLNPMSLYFIHVNKEGSSVGGNWFFQGISGYVV